MKGRCHSAVQSSSYSIQTAATAYRQQIQHTDSSYSTQTAATAYRPDILIKTKREDIHTHRCGNNRRQKCRAKGSGEEVKIQEFRYRDVMNGEPEMVGRTGYNWSHWNCNGKLKEKSVSCTGKTFDRFTTADSCTGNST
jgi:hypothetical protein